MVNFYYNVFISETPPARPIGGWYWIKPSQGQLWIYVIDGWKPIAGGNGFSTPNMGSYYLGSISQDATPTGTDNVVGKIWIQPSTGQVYMKLGEWQPIAGG